MPDLIPIEFGLPVAALAWLAVWWLERRPARTSTPPTTDPGASNV